MLDDVLTQPQDSSSEAPKPAAETPQYVSKVDYDTLVGEFQSLKLSNVEIGKWLPLINRVASALVGKPESTLKPEELQVVGELKRLMPHVLPNIEALDSLPQIQSTIQSAAMAAADALAQASFGYQLELQTEAGLKVDDPKLNRFVGVAIKEWINEDRNRAERFWRGDRTVIQEGFKEVLETVGATFRRSEKQDTLRVVAARPRSASPGGGSQASNGEVPSVDFQDKKSVRAAFRAALAS